MSKLPISFTDFVEIIRACGPMEADDCVPKRLRPILLSQLDLTEPRLADRVRHFDAEQMQAVCAYIWEGMQLVAMPST
jgi:hypothetical protein